MRDDLRDNGAASHCPSVTERMHLDRAGYRHDRWRDRTVLSSAQPCSRGGVCSCWGFCLVLPIEIIRWRPGPYYLRKKKIDRIQLEWPSPCAEDIPSRLSPLNVLRSTGPRLAGARPGRRSSAIRNYASEMSARTAGRAEIAARSRERELNQVARQLRCASGAEIQARQHPLELAPVHQQQQCARRHAH